MQNRNICCVPGCDSKLSNRKNVSIHHFPKRSIGKWLSAIKNEYLANVVTDHRVITSQRLFVCRLHFSDDQYNSRQDGTVILKPDSVPHLNLPQGLLKDVNNIDFRDLQNSPSIRNVPSNMSTSSPSVGRFTNIEAQSFILDEIDHLDHLIKNTEVVHSADCPTEVVDVRKNDCVHISRDELMEKDCTQAGIVEAEMHVEKESNTPSESMCTSTPKRRVKSPKFKYARTRNVARTILSKTEVETFPPTKRKIYEEVNKQRKEKFSAKDMNLKPKS